MAIVNSSQGTVICARVKDNVPPLRSHAISGENDGNLICTWQIVALPILTRHDMKVDMSIRIARIMFENLKCVLENICKWVVFKQH